MADGDVLYEGPVTCTACDFYAPIWELPDSCPECGDELVPHEDEAARA